MHVHSFTAWKCAGRPRCAPGPGTRHTAGTGLRRCTLEARGARGGGRARRPARPQPRPALLGSQHAPAAVRGLGLPGSRPGPARVETWACQGRDGSPRMTGWRVHALLHAAGCPGTCYTGHAACGPPVPDRGCTGCSSKLQAWMHAHRAAAHQAHCTPGPLTCASPQIWKASVELAVIGVEAGIQTMHDAGFRRRPGARTHAGSGRASEPCGRPGGAEALRAKATCS